MQIVVSLLCVIIMAVTWTFGQLVRQCRKIDAYIDRLLSEVL